MINIFSRCSDTYDVEVSMGCSSRRLSLPWTSVYAVNTTAAFFAATGWMSTDQVRKLRFVTELRVKGPDAEVVCAYQTANVENAPDSSAGVGDPITSEGVVYGSLTDISTSTGGKQLIRFGWNVRLTTGSSFTMARVAGGVEIQGD
jgi:hypothetical protein